jgi:hypothetical protein
MEAVWWDVLRSEEPKEWNGKEGTQMRQAKRVRGRAKQMLEEHGMVQFLQRRNSAGFHGTEAAAGRSMEEPVGLRAWRKRHREN